MNPAQFPIHLFDLDGVITPTAEVHMRAWGKLFTAVLDDYDVDQPYSDEDYFAYIDGKPRYDGVRDMLASRNISLPEGEDDDPADQPFGQHTVRGLGNRKNATVLDIIRTDGVDPYPGTVAYLDALPSDAKLAIVSSSKNAEEVLRAAGLRERFPVIVDGNVAARDGITGKPAPDTFLRAAELLGGTAEQAVVYEDAVAGVMAGAAGKFGAVIGVDRGVGHDVLADAGATLVVSDLEELL